MVRKNIPVNSEVGMNLDSVGGRIRAERNRLGKTIVDFALQCGVTKQTQIKYEADKNHPDTRYLERAMLQGADVMFILSGDRSTEAPLNPELQNLIEAYAASPLALKRAVFGVLLSPYKPEWEPSRVVPGYFRHEILGEDDARFEKHHAQRRAAQAQGQEAELSALPPDERALLDSYRNSSPENKARLAEVGTAFAQQVTGCTGTDKDHA